MCFAMTMIIGLLYLLTAEVSSIHWTKVIPSRRAGIFNFSNVLVTHQNKRGEVAVLFANNDFRLDDAISLVDNGPSMGLHNQDSYQYTRLFAEDISTECPYPNFLEMPAESGYYDRFPVRCPVASSVKSWWVDESRTAFAMKIFLRGGNSYRFSLLRGPEGCRIPLESLSTNDEKYIFGQCHRNVSAECPAFCKFLPSETTLRDLVLLQFDLQVPPTAGVDLKPEICTFHNAKGLWEGHSWTSPNLCNVPNPLNITMSSNSNTIQPPGKSSLGNICLIGDSHMRNMNIYFTATQAPNVVLNWNWKVVSHFVSSTTIYRVLRGGIKPPTEDLSLATALHVCMDNINNRHGALVWWFGSHAMHFSALDVTKVVSMAIDEIQHRLQNNPLVCIVVVGVLDTMFETIPKHIGTMSPFLQNSWRIQMQNNALRHAVSSLNLTNVHFVDVFPQSLALHYNGHRKDDPVHYSAPVYRFLGNHILQSVKQLCVKK